LRGMRFTDRISFVGLIVLQDLSFIVCAEVAEWQTRYVQGVVSTRHESSNLSFGTINFTVGPSDDKRLHSLKR
jgi:hypothetical protein